LSSKNPLGKKPTGFPGEPSGSSLEPIFESLTKTYFKLLELGLVYHEKEVK